MQKEEKIYKIIFILVLSLLTITTIYYILKFNNIVSLFRNLLILFLILVGIIICIKIIKKKITFTKGVLINFYFLILMISISNLKKIYYKLDSITVSNYVSAGSIIKLKNNDNSDFKIGLLVDDVNLFKINSFLFKIDTFDSYTSILDALYNREINYAYVPSNYVDMFKNISKFQNIGNDTEIIYTNYKNKKIEDKNIDIRSDSFSLLIMGVDSEEDGVIDKSANGDALILLTFNPKNYHATILSIPRDTYTNISCTNKKSKITHASWYGDDCMINSIEELFDIDINYFIKINFKGMVNLIDLIGGIDIDVPISFCEQDSNRDYENEICINKGKNHLNGEETLALARHRKTINDFIRGDNQKLIIEALAKKIKNNIDINFLSEVLNEISNNVVTNIKLEEFISIYNAFKDIKIDNILYKLKIEGYDATIYDKEMKMNLYNFVPYTESIKNISNKMHQNLNGEEIEEDNIISKKSDVVLLPKFEYISEVKNFCEEYDIEYKINYIEGSRDGVIVSQSIAENTDINYIDGELIVEVTKKFDCASSNDEKCMVPNFINKEYSSFRKWLKNNNYSFIVDEEKIDKNNKKYNKEKAGLIVEQNISNIYISELIGKKLKIKYMEK